MEHSADAITRLVLQLAVILSVAKLGGEISERYLKTPSVVGELAAGIIIGPFALGGVDLPWLGPLFEHAEIGSNEAAGFSIPVSESLWSIAQIGAIILLFNAGLETNLRQFLRYAGSASLVAIGGAALPFVLGAAATVAFGFADGFTDPTALFIGAIFMATSIGISVRILADLQRLDTPEGVTILAAAVLDDVLGVLALTIVIGIAAGGELSVGSFGLITLKTLGFWVALTGVGILLAKPISNLFDKFQVSGGALVLTVALAFFAASLAESFGLAMIIGAFSMGLALSGTELSDRMDEPLRGVVAVFIPIFFVVMGTLVDVSTLGGVWTFGIAFTAVAVVGKVVGSAVPALVTGFNRHGALRIGAGMLPRGEVTLIMVGIGISNGVIEHDLFGISIIMIIVSAVLAPVILSRSFKTGATGVRSGFSAQLET
ncbi:MAG: hypothetical protein BZY67_01265 [SAR202 cluster bacterium Io17-Chloro-G1]|nr:MAG: hypothetical protein BZY67_01265 [SAR202 cluster bacterium Io17-Chloro-G1]